MAEFGKVLIYLIVGILFCSLGIFMSYTLTIKRSKINIKKEPQKQAQLAIYECGEESKGDAWIQFNPRFYAMGLIFIIFDIEILLLFPWSLSFESFEDKTPSSLWLVLCYTEGLLFIFILALGLAYIWYREDVNWIRPKTQALNIPTQIPLEEYEKFNQRF